MILLMNGWATNNSVWGSIPNIPEKCLFYDVNQSTDLKDIVTFIDSQDYSNEPLTVIGWSLGSILALELAAAYPGRISQLILVSATACFTARKDYPAGQPVSILRRLVRKVKSDANATRKSFYYQMFSPTEVDDCIKFLQNEPPLLTSRSLLAGLAYLENHDLRDSLPRICIPVLILQGTEDTICPFSAGQYLASHLPQAELISLANCGHIPFFTQKETFWKYVMRRMTK